MFPCWDESTALATYDLEIVGPKNGKVLTNMPAMTVVDNESYRISTFNSTRMKLQLLLRTAQQPNSEVSILDTNLTTL